MHVARSYHKASPKAIRKMQKTCLPPQEVASDARSKKEIFRELVFSGDFQL